MSQIGGAAFPAIHSHVFLSEDHQKSERKTWAVIWLCSAMMVAEIVGGWLFGSIALVADGLHMSTHAGALLLGALAYIYSRRYADDPRFTFGTGKLGDLAGFTSAIILAMIALLNGYEAISRLFEPVPIHSPRRYPLLSSDLRSTSPAPSCSAAATIMAIATGMGHLDEDETNRITTNAGDVVLEVFEDGVPPRFRLRAERGTELVAAGGARSPKAKDWIKVKNRKDPAADAVLAARAGRLRLRADRPAAHSKAGACRPLVAKRPSRPLDRLSPAQEPPHEAARSGDPDPATAQHGLGWLDAE